MQSILRVTSDLEIREKAGRNFFGSISRGKSGNFQILMKVGEKSGKFIRSRQIICGHPVLISLISLMLSTLYDSVNFD